MQRRPFLIAGLGALPALSLAQTAATDYPKPGSTIRYIVPFPPGGLTDNMARIIGQQLAERWKVSVVIDNRPGGGAQIGADAAAKSAPDGTTLLAITLTHAINYSLYPKAPYNFTKDLKPVALLAGSQMLVVVPAASPIKTFAELVAAAKQKKLNAGSSGNGTAPHMTLALFNSIAGTDIQHVPYKGGAPSISDLLGGQLDVIFSNFPESVSHVKAGKLRALAIASRERNPAVPDVPTTAEVGMPGLVVDNWTALMVPAGTPDLIVDRLSAESVKILQSADVAEKAKQQGFIVDARPASQFAPFLDAEVQRWAKIVKDANIKSE